MVGIDLGSRTVKMVTMREGELVHQAIYDTVAFYRNYASMIQGKLTLDHTLLEGNGQTLVATGYGKMTVPLAGALMIPEIQAHVRGAVYQTGKKDFTLLDVGGQDTKVICVRNGQAVDFLTNDRCASGSGRYLENMAQIIGLPVEELGVYHQEPVDLNSTCAIFSETEIISRIVEGYSAESLAAGVNHALFKRLSPMLKKLKSGLVLLAGGGALNQALHYYIREELQVPAEQLPQSQLNGAIGCCIWGYDQMEGEE